MPRLGVMFILRHLLLSLLLDHLNQTLPPPLGLFDASLALRSDIIDFLEPLSAILFMIDTFLGIFLLPLPDFLLGIDLKQRFFCRFILGKLPKLKIEIRLQHP